MPPTAAEAAIATAVRAALDAIGSTEPERPEPEDADRLANDLTTAARRTGLSRTTLYRLMDAGELDYVKIGARRLIPEDALRALVAGHRAAAA